MRKVLLTLFLVTMMVVVSMGTAMAESILFPYVASTTANLDTLVSVINTSPAAFANQLHYRYFVKQAGIANENINPCNEVDYFRPTTENDIVTFAVGRDALLGSGNAMFNDLTNYNAGALNPPQFGHNLQALIGPGLFGFTMVTTANNNADVNCNALAVGVLPLNHNTCLDGEAALYDLVSGAMWGYRALPSNVEAAVAALTPATVNSYVFNTWQAGPMGATDRILNENIAATANMPQVTIYPNDQFTTRYFINPVMATTGLAPVVADADMRFPNTHVTRIAMVDRTALVGFYGRNEDPLSGTTGIDVRCVGRIDAVAITGGAGSQLNCPAGSACTVGGWGLLDLQDCAAIPAMPPFPALPACTVVPATGYNAWVAELKFGVLTGLPGIINDGKPVTDWGWSR